MKVVYQSHFHDVSAVRSASPVGKFHKDDGTWAYPSGGPSGDGNIPVGGVYLSIVPTNPAITLGYGTWELIAQGKYLKGNSS